MAPISGMQIITPETLEALALALTSPPIGKRICYRKNAISKKLTRDDLTNFAAEGRLCRSETSQPEPIVPS